MLTTVCRITVSNLAHSNNAFYVPNSPSWARSKKFGFRENKLRKKEYTSVGNLTVLIKPVGIVIVFIGCPVFYWVSQNQRVAALSRKKMSALCHHLHYFLSEAGNTEANWINKLQARAGQDIYIFLNNKNNFNSIVYNFHALSSIEYTGVYFKLRIWDYLKSWEIQLKKKISETQTGGYFMVFKPSKQWQLNIS